MKGNIKLKQFCEELETALDKHDMRGDLDPLYKLRDYPWIGVMSRFTRFFATDHAKIIDAIKDITGKVPEVSETVGTPLIRLDPADTTKIQVFTNILVASHNANILKQVSWLANFPMLRPSHTRVKEMLAKNPKTSPKWATVSASIRTCKSYRTMTIGQYLKTYVPLGDMKDDQVRNLSDKVQSCFAPAQFTECESVKDYMDMYASGPNSCMTTHTSRNWNFLVKEKSHPAAYYHFCPTYKGVFLSKGGKVTARAILHAAKNSKGHPTFKVVRTFASNNPAQEELWEHIKKAGYLASGGNFDYSMYKKEGISFEIPGVPMQGKSSTAMQMAVPFPYIDGPGDERIDVDFKYDVETTVFTITINQKGGEGLRQTESGYMSAAACSSLKCACCGSRISADREAIVGYQMPPDQVYCRSTCARSEGLHELQRSDGSTMWASKAEYPGYNGWWDKHNMQQWGAIPVLSNMEDLRQWYSLVINGEDKKLLKNMDFNPVGNGGNYEVTVDLSTGPSMCALEPEFEQSLHGLFRDVYTNTYGTSSSMYSGSMSTSIKPIGSSRRKHKTDRSIATKQTLEIFVEIASTDPKVLIKKAMKVKEEKLTATVGKTSKWIIKAPKKRGKAA